MNRQNRTASCRPHAVIPDIYAQVNRTLQNHPEDGGVFQGQAARWSPAAFGPGTETDGPDRGGGWIGPSLAGQRRHSALRTIRGGRLCGQGRLGPVVMQLLGEGYQRMARILGLSLRAVLLDVAVTIGPLRIGVRRVPTLLSAYKRLDFGREGRKAGAAGEVAVMPPTAEPPAVPFVSIEATGAPPWPRGRGADMS